MIQVIGTLRIPPGTIGAVRPVMEAMVLSSRAEAGCLAYSYAIDVLDDSLIHVIEAWADREALAAHFESGHLETWRAEFTRLGITGRNLRLFETGPGEVV